MKIRSIQKGNRGSVTLLAFLALFVLSVLIMALHYSLGSRYKQVHHAYYHSKAMALIEGLNAIARGLAQEQLEQIIEKAGDWYEISGVKEKAASLNLISEGGAIKPVIKVEARILKDRLLYLAKQSKSRQTTIREDIDPKAKGIFKDGNEVEGIVEIKVNCKLEGFEKTAFSVPEKTIITQYEFKRLRRVPRFIRHFTLFIKEALTKKEDPDKYAPAHGNFNYTRVPMTGGRSSAGVLFLQNSSDFGGSQLPEVPEGNGGDEDKKMNPFYDKIGYVYLGGDGDNRAFLNLTAGDDKQPYTETFQLYRGTTTDFYKVWDTDFENFIENARRQKAGKGSPPAAGQNESEESVAAAVWSWFKDKVKTVLSWFKKAVATLAKLDQLEYSGKIEKSTNLPLYYIVRKDYGYAEEWGKSENYRRFGFKGSSGNDAAQDIFCNCLHLYGTTNFDGSYCVSPTLVMGNVYRRYLSLSGYKQRRADETPSSRRKYEVQAGPIEYFETYKDLVKRQADPSTDKPDEAPIWVWDARVDWNRNSSSVNGVYMPISGPALLGRLIPGLARLWNDDKEKANALFVHSIIPPVELGSTKPEESASAIVNRGGDFDEKIKGGISPLFVKLHEAKFFDLGTRGENYHDGAMFDGASPYFEEISRCFCYASYGTVKKLNEGHGGNDDLDADLEQIVRDAADRWQHMLDNGKGELKPKIIDFPKDMKLKECKRKGKFWEPDDNDPNDENSKIFPFTLPDPWSDKAPAGGRKFADNFQKAFESKFSDTDEFFKRYFYHLMTNPAMIQPYNYGMRFMYRPLRDLFAKSADERAQLLSQKIIPEIRDGAFPCQEGKNDYMKREKKERFNKPINDDILKDILKKRASDNYLQKGYFFMDDYGRKTKSPADIDLADVFKGRRHFWKMDWDDFKKRFVSIQDNTMVIRLNTIVALTDDLKLSGKEVQVVGGGAILVGSGAPNKEITIDGDCEISTNLKCSQPLFIVAKNITVAAEQVDACLVALDTFSLGRVSRCRINGNVCANSWDFQSIVSGGGQYLLSFNSAIKTDDSYIQNIEPRIHRFHIVGGEK